MCVLELFVTADPKSRNGSSSIKRRPGEACSTDGSMYGLLMQLRSSMTTPEGLLRAPA